jgi:hypothetical protein
VIDLSMQKERSPAAREKAVKGDHSPQKTLKKAIALYQPFLKCFFFNLMQSGLLPL